VVDDVALPGLPVEAIREIFLAGFAGTIWLGAASVFLAADGKRAPWCRLWTQGVRGACRACMWKPCRDRSVSGAQRQMAALCRVPKVVSLELPVNVPQASAPDLLAER